MTIEALVGPMASGKTEEMIRRIRRAQIAGQKIQVFRSHLDTRSDPHFIITLNEEQWPAETVTCAEDILDRVEEDTTVVGVDDAQFFGKSLVGVCRVLSEQRKRVVVAGLDTDFCGEPFVGPVPDLLAIASDVTKLTAVCMVCKGEKGEATKSQRLIDGQPARHDALLIVVGWVGDGERGETYEPRCESCHEVPGIEELLAQRYGISE